MNMKRYASAIGTVVLVLSGCTKPIGPPEVSNEPNESRLADERRGFRTAAVKLPGKKSPVPKPPAGTFDLVKYKAEPGELSAYVTTDPKDGAKHPAIVWITGGDCNSIDDGCWTPGPTKNDQSASAYRKAGIVTMFPSLRGGNDNPGIKEGFLGEVDDVVAAADYLSRLPYVDPNRIYLGGHSTGGTLVLLTAEVTGRFRAIFSFGPVDDVEGYPPQFLPVPGGNPREIRLRSPGYWLHCVESPTFVIEGTVDGNVDELKKMAAKSKNPNLHFYPVPKADHFNVLAPMNAVLAQKILKDTGPKCNIALEESELTFAK